MTDGLSPEGQPQPAVAAPDLTSVEGVEAELARELPEHATPAEAPALIDSTPWTQPPQAVEVPEPHVETDDRGNTVVPQMSSEAKGIIGSKVDGEGKAVGRIDLEQLPVMEAYVQNMRAAIAEGQAGVDKANKAFEAALKLVEAGPQQEFGVQMGVKNDGEQAVSRKADMSDPVDAATVKGIQTGRAQYDAAVKYMTQEPEAPVAANEPTPGIIDGVPEHLQARPQPDLKTVPDLITADDVPSTPAEPVHDIRVPAPEEVQPPAAE